MRLRRINLPEAGKPAKGRQARRRQVKLLGIVRGAVRVMADREWIWRGMIGDWQDEWDLKRHGSYRSVNRHDTCRVAAYLNKTNPADAKGIVAD